jgi:replicative DNA helicase
MGIIKQQFISGVVDKYPEELLEFRINIEANMIACIFKDPDILSESNFSSTSFKTKDARFLFGIASKLKEKNVTVFDEVAILSNFNEDIIEKFNELGGYRAINNLTDIVNINNYDFYADEFAKSETILRLFDMGFNLFNEVKVGNKQKRPIDIFKDLTAQEVLNFYEMQLNGIDIATVSHDILDECSIEMSDEIIEEIQDGSLNGVPFDSFGKDEDGNEITVYPILSNYLNGYLPGTTNAICGYSSTGKSCLWTSIILGLLYRNQKCLIVSNEMSKTPYIINIITWIAYKKFHNYTLTKDKLRKGNLNDEEKQLLDKIKKFWNDNYKDKLFFVHIPDSNIDTVKRKVRQYAIRKGIDFFLVDTLKCEISDMKGNDNVWLNLIKQTRIIDELAKRYSICAGVSIQLTSATKGKLFLDESVISMSKQIIEVCESMLCIRNVYDICELTPGTKEYLRPFRIEKNKTTGKYESVDYTITGDALDYNYKVIFCVKNRNGMNTESSGEAFLYAFVGHQAVFKESYRCRPVHGYLQ